MLNIQIERSWCYQIEAVEVFYPNVINGSAGKPGGLHAIGLQSIHWKNRRERIMRGDHDVFSNEVIGHKVNFKVNKVLWLSTILNI